MATVRLSMAIRETVLKRATNAYESANPPVTLGKAATDTLVGIIKSQPLYRAAQVMYDTCMADPIIANMNIDQRGELATACPTMRGVTAMLVRNGQGRMPCERITMSGYVELLGPTSIYWSNKPNVPRDLSDDDFAYDLKTESMSAADAATVGRIAVDHKLEVSQRTQKMSAHLNQIRLLLDSCTTVKQLLEAWPASESLLPEAALATHRAPSQKRAPAHKVAELDPSVAAAMNVGIVTAKLTGQLDAG